MLELGAQLDAADLLSPQVAVRVLDETHIRFEPTTLALQAVKGVL